MVCKNKRGMESEMIGRWILGLITLVVMVVVFMVLKEKGAGALDFLKNIFRLR
jgi:hypothetical protein